MTAARRIILAGSVLLLAGGWLAIDFLGAGGLNAPTREATRPMTESASFASMKIANRRPGIEERLAPISPLRGISLDSLRQTVERPLFNASRVPKPTSVQQVEDRSGDEPEADPNDITLLGIVVTNNDRTALLRWNKTNEVLRLKIGENSTGWKLRQVQPTSVVIEKDELRLPLRLFEPSHLSLPSQLTNPEDYDESDQMEAVSRMDDD
jgi:hypothetical protein